MGLEYGDSLRVLQSVFDDRPDALMRRFYASWFYLDDSVRPLFGPDMAHQHTAFAHAFRWLLGEFAAQRAADPIAFLVQLGRDHRKYGVTEEHYPRMCQAMFLALRAELGDRWTDEIDETATETLTLIAGVMSGAASADPQPPWWDATVLEHHRVSRDIAIVRVQSVSPVPYQAGQYVSVQVPQCPRQWRYLSPAASPDPNGLIEFHVRTVPGGAVSTAVVTGTEPGDRWRVSSPLGGMHVDRDGGDVLMVAGSTGLAPLRALILDLSRFDGNPRVHLFFGARHPCELYDLPALWELASCHPWLSVTPVCEQPGNPAWASDYPDPEPPRGLHVRQIGRLPEVVSGYGGWGDRQILLCGRPDMVLATRAALIANGADASRIQHDPLVD